MKLYQVISLAANLPFLLGVTPNAFSALDISTANTGDMGNLPPNITNAVDTIVVAQDGSGDYLTISKAYAAAKDGSIIEIKEGEYTCGIEINKDIELVGIGDGSRVKLIGYHASSLIFNCNEAILHNCSLSYKGDSGEDIYVVVVLSGKVIMEAVDVAGGISTGVAVNGSDAHLELYDCSLHNNGGNGLTVWNGGSAELYSCQIYENTLPGIAAHENKELILTDCTINNNDAGIGIYFTTGREGTGGTFKAYNCIIRDNKSHGIYMCAENSQGYLESCQIINNGGYGVYLEPGGEASAKECLIENNAQGITNGEYTTTTSPPE